MKISIEKIGVQYNLSGVILSDGKKSYNLFFPNEIITTDLISECLSIDEWKQILNQMDNVYIKIQNPDKTLKTMIRKSQRMIEQNIRWKVFKRDRYSCQYCGRNGVPLTVDHYIPQELGGETIEENLKTCCRSCNKRKGDMTSSDWEKELALST